MIKLIIHILFDPIILNKKNRTKVLASSDDLATVLNTQFQYPKSSYYFYKSDREGIERFEIGRIRCHRCGKDVYIVDNELNKSFPFCGIICGNIDLLNWLTMGEDDEIDTNDDDNIE